MDSKKNILTDFAIDIPDGREIRILQLTDIQTIHLEGVRETPGDTRLYQVRGAFFSDEASHNDEIRAWRYVREGVSLAHPDLIVLTGDNIYGQTDDDGRQWTDFCTVLDSLGIPWAVVFGNHDNESGKGVSWQIEQVQKTKYGMICPGNITGNCNYTVGIRQGGQYRTVLYMMDTNGCHVYDNPGEGMAAVNVDRDRIASASGIHDDQLAWMKSSYRTITESCKYQVPSMIFMHIPSAEFADAVDVLYPGARSEKRFVPDRVGDFGISYEKATGFGDGGKFWNTAKEIGCTNIFAGHQHRIATSIVYDGIRLTYGMKTGTYDYFHQDMLGSTLITLCDQDTSPIVEYLHSRLEYVPVPGAWKDNG